MTILTPQLAGYMLDEWAMRQQMRDRWRSRGTLLDAALRRRDAPEVRRSVGMSLKKPNWKRPRA